MKRKDFENFKISLNLNIEVDSSLRRITEKIKLIAQHRNPSVMHSVVKNLSCLDEALDSIITAIICDDSVVENLSCSDEALDSIITSNICDDENTEE